MGDETHKPYDRPPLSKELLASTNLELPSLVKPEDYKALELDERLGWSATSLNVEELSVEIKKASNVEKIKSDAILIATGARARNIFEQSLSGVYTLRTFDDCQVIRNEFLKLKKVNASKVVVIGAGFIGCEVAATARSLGLEVSIVEMASQPLVEILGNEMGELVADIHRQNGVDLKLNTVVNGLVSKDKNPKDKNQVAGVELADGSILEADVVIVGVGAIPNTEWLQSSGLTLDNGVVCDEFCMAAPKVAATGDVAKWKNLRFGVEMRVEHRDNATEQSKIAAINLLEKSNVQPYTPIPWFWSDQYEHKIQLFGLSSSTDVFEIIEGSMADRKFVALYKREGKVVGVLGLNSPRQVIQNRQLIEADFPI